MKQVAQIAVLAFFLAAPLARAEHSACSGAPTPVVTLNYASRYVDDDPSRATINPEREAEAESAIAPVDEFISSLTINTQQLYSGRSRSRESAAKCILDRMAIWARADALSNLETETVRITIGARYAAFALILWQTLPYAYEHPDRAAILAWLNRRMDEQREFWVDAPKGTRMGNLRAWAGLAGSALALQTQNVAMRDWGAEAINDVLCTANPDGSLPQEMKRGRLALHYQLHAIAPLVTAAALLERQGVQITRVCDGALRRIVDFTVADLEGGRATERITGLPQSLFEDANTLHPYQLAWIEPYLAIADSPDLTSMRERLGTVTYSKLGGDQTALWGQLTPRPYQSPGDEDRLE